MAFFDLVVTYIPLEDRVPSTNPDYLNWFVRIETDPYEERPASGFDAWVQENYGNPSNVQWATYQQWWQEYQSYMCDEDGNYETNVYVHKIPRELAYKIELSHGSFVTSEPYRERKRKTESFSVERASSYTIQGYAVTNIICAQWEGSVRDFYGNKILPKPDITVPDEPALEVDEDLENTINFSKLSTGVVRVTFEYEFDRWPIEIAARETDGDEAETGSVTGTGEEEEDIDNSGGYGVSDCEDNYDPNDGSGASKYESVVTVTWDGGIEREEVEVPEMMENGDCGGGGGGSVTIETPEDGGCYNLIITKHKCTGEIISEELEEIPCPDSD